MTETLWVTSHIVGTDWSKISSALVMNDNGELVKCANCPCPPPPPCVPCQLFPGRIDTNYYEIWGVPCDESNCDSTPVLLGTYDVREYVAEHPGFVGCVWSQWDADHPNCLVWMGVYNRCVPNTICRERICSGDICQVRLSKVEALCQSKSMYSRRGTGWLYQRSNTSALTSVIFHYIEWELNEKTGVYTGWLMGFSCSCDHVLIATGSFSGGPPSSPSDFGYNFIPSEKACETGCESTIALLLAQAEQNGWLVKGEGVMVSKPSSGSTCYTPSVSSKFQVCVDTGSSFIGITCDCRRVTIGDGPFDVGYSGYAYIEMSACDCADIRELILSYPAMFGVVDIEFGDDTVYTKASTGGSTSSSMCMERNGYDLEPLYCDYRNMYVIYDNSCSGGSGMRLMRYKVDGSSSQVDSIQNGTIYFDGKVAPFTSGDDAKAIWANPTWVQWQGYTIRWTGLDWARGDIDGPFYTQAEAEQRAASWTTGSHSDSFNCGVSTSSYFYPPESSTGPNLNPVTVPAEVFQYDPNSGEWYVQSPYHDWQPFAYNLNFVMTNKGFLVNGRSGYSNTLQVDGFTQTRTHFSNPYPTDQDLINNVMDGKETMCEYIPEGSVFPQSVVCPVGTVKDVSFKTAIMSVPAYDMSFHITDVDNSMHGCQEESWWPVNENQSSN